MQQDDLMRARMQSVGFKPTGARARVLAVIEGGGGGHLTADAVYRQLSDDGTTVSLATVYRILAQFEAAGLVVRHRFEGGKAVYEPASPEHHDHLRCLKCGRIDEFRDEVIEDRQAAVARDAGFEFLDHTLILFGLCGACRARAPRPAED